MTLESFISRQWNTNPGSIRDNILALKKRISNPPFDPAVWLYHMAVVRKECNRVLIGDVVANPATGRRFVVQSVGSAVVLRELGTGQSVKTRTLRGLVPEVEARKREAFTRFAGGRPELYEMVFAWPAAEHDARLLICCDFLQDGGWGAEWADRAEGVRAVIEREMSHGRR